MPSRLIYAFVQRRKAILTTLLFLSFPVCKICTFEESFREQIVSEPSTQYYNVTASHAPQFIWYRVSKVGSSTIRVILQQNKIPLFIQGVDIPFNPEHYKDYFQFAFVRNPWDRIVSCYFNKIVDQPYEIADFRECIGKGFEYFVDFINRQDLTVADRHIRLQTKLIPLDHVDFIGRFETFSEDLQYVCNILGLGIAVMPHANVSKHEHYSRYYTKRTKEIIAKKYKDDIKIFRYQFEKK